MDESLTVESAAESNETLNIPSNLKEFGDVPDNYRIVYRWQSRKDLSDISKKGFVPKMNYMDEVAQQHNSRIEEIFDEARLEQNIDVDRGESLMAYPRHPSKVQDALKFDPENHVLLEFAVDPKKAKVVDSKKYGDASVMMDTLEQEGEDDVRKDAIKYWSDAVSLSDYLDNDEKVVEDHTGSLSDFYIPEVLVPIEGSISPDMVRVWNPDRIEESDQQSSGSRLDPLFTEEQRQAFLNKRGKRKGTEAPKESGGPENQQGRAKRVLNKLFRRS